jgi:heme oxygenase (biliverdin-IX-beta and delta-forming)
MGWVAASEYAQAQSDPLVEHKSDIMQHMNADHKAALILLAKRFAGIEAQEAEMTSVDRLGFHLRLKTQDGVKGTRIAFLREVRDPAQTREVLVTMLASLAQDGIRPQRAKVKCRSGLDASCRIIPTG